MTELVRRLKTLGFPPLWTSGDGSQQISNGLFKAGMPSSQRSRPSTMTWIATDLTFGFSTAVQIASRITWINWWRRQKAITGHHHGSHGPGCRLDCLHTAISGGAEICLIPEIPYDLDRIVEKNHGRYRKVKGLSISLLQRALNTWGRGWSASKPSKRTFHMKLGGIGNFLRAQLEAAGISMVRTTILGHVQRAGHRLHLIAFWPVQWA